MFPKKKLSEIATIYNGNSINKTVKEQNYMKDVPGWNYIGTKDVDFDGSITYKTGVIIPFTETKFRTAPVGAVFVCSEGGSAGKKTAIVKEEVCFGNKLFAIVNKDNQFSPKYLYYYTRYEAFLDQFRGLASTLMGGISTKNFGNIEVPFPKLEEQELIVSEIEGQFSSLDNAVKTLNKTKEQLVVYRQAVLKEAFAQCVNNVEINAICEHVTDGDHMPPPKSEKGIPFIMISNVQDNKIIWDNTAFVDETYYSEIGEKRTPINGDILYTVTGSYGIPVLIDFDKDFCFQRHIALLRPKKDINQKFLYYALQTPDVYTQATKGATGTAQKTVGLGVLRKIKVPFDKDISKQKSVVIEVETRLALCEYIQNTVDKALMDAEAMRQSILKEAFEGRLI